MARTCFFCQRWFSNKQAVRRHLGYCVAYRSRNNDEISPSAPPSAPRQVRALDLCVRCGSSETVAYSGRCVCGHSTFISEDLKPISCEQCGWLTGTSRGWDGYCGGCRWPLSAEAQQLAQIQAEIEKLKAERRNRS